MQYLTQRGVSLKKILFMINTLSGGGAEKVIVDLLNSLDKNKYSVDLLSITGGIHAKRLSDRIHHRVLVENHISVFGRYITKFIYHLPYRLFRWLFIKKRYDLEIAYLEGFPTRVIASGKNRHTPKVAFVHCDISVKRPLRNYYPNDSACLAEYQAFDKVCFVSNQAKEGFERVYGVLENAIVVHNVVNREEIAQKAVANTDFSFHTNGLKIISIGRLAYEKAFDRLIKIAAQLEKKYDFEICILGEGDQRKYLEGLIEKLKVKSVKLLGFQENPYNYMVKADLFVCSSLFEGYSTTVTECIILNLPVVTTDCAGMDELLNNGEYGIITPNTEEGLLNGLETILADEQILRRFKEKITKKTVTDNIQECENVFNELLQGEKHECCN